MTKFALIALSFLSFSTVQAAAPVGAPTAPKANPAPSSAPLAAPTASESSKDDKVLWDVWYTATLNGTLHYIYYNEKAEIKGKKIHMQVNLWRQEDGFINEEQIGEFAENSPNLTPLFYNFHSVAKGLETMIDGTVENDGKLLTVRVRKGKQDQPVVKGVLPPKTFFSQFTPIWLGTRISAMPQGKTFSFSSILEDRADLGFKPITCQIRKEAPDEIANRTKTSRVWVDCTNLKSFWWVDEQGHTARIEVPEQSVVVERVEKAVALKFFEASTTAPKK